MKTIILYSSKYGSTEDCAKALKSKLEGESELVNLKNARRTDFQQYDWVIIGGSIYAGKIQKEVKKFCEGNIESLLTKNIAVFMCCITAEQVNDFFIRNFPAELLAHAAQTVNFGGELRQEKMGFLFRKLTVMIEKSGPVKSGILSENIDSLAVLVNSFN